jgi:hypothetical protein
MPQQTPELQITTPPPTAQPVQAFYPSLYFPRHFMCGSYSLVWGLVSDHLCQGKLLDRRTAIAVQQAGWNPPNGCWAQRNGATVLENQLRGLQHPESSAAELNVQQLAVGWRHALLLLSDGQVYVCDASDWRQSCEPAANDGW